MEITKELKDKFYQETGIPWEHLTEREQLEIQLNGGLEIDQLEDQETVARTIICLADLDPSIEVTPMG